MRRGFRVKAGQEKASKTIVRGRLVLSFAPATGLG